MTGIFTLTVLSFPSRPPGVVILTLPDVDGAACDWVVVGTAVVVVVVDVVVVVVVEVVTGAVVVVVVSIVVVGAVVVVVNSGLRLLLDLVSASASEAAFAAALASVIAFAFAASVVFLGIHSQVMNCGQGKTINELASTSHRHSFLQPP